VPPLYPGLYQSCSSGDRQSRCERSREEVVGFKRTKHRLQGSERSHAGLEESGALLDNMGDGSSTSNTRAWKRGRGFLICSVDHEHKHAAHGVFPILCAAGQGRWQWIFRVSMDRGPVPPVGSGSGSRGSDSVARPTLGESRSGTLPPPGMAHPWLSAGARPTVRRQPHHPSPKPWSWRTERS
jgi:hypothetical protein